MQNYLLVSLRTIWFSATVISLWICKAINIVIIKEITSAMGWNPFKNQIPQAFP